MNNYPGLNNCRNILFDPLGLDGGKLLAAVSEPNSTLLGIGEPRAAGQRTIRAPLPIVLEMMDAATLRFDLIVTSVPNGTMIASEGIPKPPKVGATVAPAGTKRKLLFTGPTSGENPEAVPEIKLIPPMDAGYAAWLLVNHLLAPFGEALIGVSKESFALIEKCPMFNRVWATDDEVDISEGIGRRLLYVARDHKQPPSVLLRGKPSSYSRSSFIRGTVFDSLTARRTVLTHFDAIRDEARKTDGDLTNSLPNVYLWEGKLRTRFSTFEVLVGKFPVALIDQCNQYSNRTLVELAVMKDTREKVRALLKNKDLRIGDDALAVFEDLCKQMTHLTAPFNRPSPTQRVAWLDENSTLRCNYDFSTFKKGKTYRVDTLIITGKKKEIRHRPGFGSEEILVSGQECLLNVGDQPVNAEGFYELATEVNFFHSFTQFVLSAEMPEATNYKPEHQHTLSELIENFAMPDVLDIAEADPTTYEKYVARLKALET